LSLERCLTLLWRNLFLILCVVGVQACGFQPLYGPHSAFPQDDLQQIDVKVITDRSGQIMRNKLLYLLHHQAKTKKAYVLDVVMSESRSDQVYDRDATAKRAVIKIDVRMVLRPSRDTKVLFEKTLDESIGFSFGPNAEFASYTSIVSEVDAKERLIEHLSRKITHELSLYFHRKNTNKPLD
jgi:hypothetical protein